MNNHPPKFLRLALLTAGCAGLLTAAQGAVNPVPQLVTKDKIGGLEGVYRNGSGFTDSGGGRSGQTGDYAANFPLIGSGPIYVADASIFSTAGQNDQLTVAFWTKKYDIAAGSAFWANSPSSPSTTRGAQAHVPWSNNNIYFDTAGCCGPDTRINAGIDTFSGYTGDISWWTNEWHHFAFTKNGPVKQIWIDGELFLEGAEAIPLPTDFTDLYLGADGVGGGLYHGLIDDFTVFSTALTEAQIDSLVTGTEPNTLPAAAGLLAYWDFDDYPSEGQFIRVSPTPNTTGASPNLIEVVHGDGAVAWEQGNVSLKLDGAAVPATFTKAGKVATIRYESPTLLPVQSEHTATLTYPGANGPQTLEWKFRVGTYTKDTVANRLGVFTGASSYTADGGGRTGAAGDYAANFPLTSFTGGPSGPVYVADASFFNVGATNDQGTVAFWTKKYDTAAGSAFWANSTLSPGGRGFQAHVPWDNNNIYFDTAGCCGADTRINANIDTFSGYTGDAGFWTNWHHIVFVKNGATKQIWIDGQFFLDGAEAGPLLTDFTDMYIGANTASGGLYHGLIDDFAVFSTALTDTQITSLAGGAAPTSLPSSAGLVANWNFNDIPAQGMFLSFLPSNESTNALPNLIRIEHQQGSAQWDLTKVSLTVDGAPVTATTTRVGSRVVISYVPSTPFTAGSSHTAVLTYPNATGGTETRQWTFTVAPYTFDSVSRMVGSIGGAAKFTADRGGRSGAAGDFAVDFGTRQAGQYVYIPNAAFLNQAAANDDMAVVGWQKLHSVASSAFYWATSPSSSGNQRGFGAFPWGDQNIYFDTAGCCDPALHRINGAVSTVSDYLDAGWWTNWHHFVYQKRGATKEIWIDGQLFASGENTNPLPTDFTESFIGYDVPDNARIQGIIDDFAVYGTALTDTQVAQLASGGLPSALPASTELLAYWNFNDATSGSPVQRPPLSATRSGNTLTLTYQGILESTANIDGTWAPVQNATSPFPVTMSENRRFYRVRSN